MLLVFQKYYTQITKYFIDNKRKGERIKYGILLYSRQMITLSSQSDWFVSHRMSGNIAQPDHIWNPFGDHLKLK